MFRRVLELCRLLACELGVLAIAGYRWFIRPMLPDTCRMSPSCSEYARQCLEYYSPLRALIQITRRLLRCHPFSRVFYDPVQHPNG